MDVEQFKKDIDGDEVAERVAADRERGTALGQIARPVVFINGQRARLQGNVEKGLHDEIQAALSAKAPGK